MFWLAWLAFALTYFAQPEEPTYSEAAVKAAYLLNFGRFVEWPAQGASPAPLTLCMLGEDPFGEVLDQMIEGQLVQGRKIELRRIPRPRATSHCDIAYIGFIESDRVREAISRLNRSPTLTVSDSVDFIEQGGMIEFRKSSERVTFRINLGAAQGAGLKLSSKLLKIAEEVK